MSKAPNLPELFEINLISDRVDRMRRRQVLGRVGDFASFVMLGVAVLFYFAAALNLWTIIRARASVNKLNASIAAEEVESEKLELAKTAAINSVALYQKLLPIYERRILWASKLTALANLKPKGMGVIEVVAQPGNSFPEEEVIVGSQTKKSIRRRKSQTPLDPDMHFKVIYLPSAGDTDDPMKTLRADLLRSEIFMDKMEVVEVLRVEKGAWSESIPVRIFRCVLKGKSVDNET
jgi:hypothetical protein